MNRPDAPLPLDDARFPSGPWTGFFLQPNIPGRHVMELILTFANGEVKGEGRDRIGDFLIRGRFEPEDGSCWWTKSYVGLHDVTYKGFNEGKGVWGTWEIGTLWRGGFHIWPEGMADPTKPRMAAEEDLPVLIEEFAEQEADAELVTVGR